MIIRCSLSKIKPNVNTSYNYMENIQDCDSWENDYYVKPKKGFEPW
jgi:hypothetical protein